MTRRKVADLDELSEGEPHIVEVNGREVGLFRLDGSVYALPNRCPHQGGPLCEGPVDGTVVADDEFRLRYDHDDEIVFCPWHQLPIRVTTGDCLSLAELSVPTYEADVDGRDVYVDLSKPGQP